MLRRLFLLTPVSFWSRRLHLLAKHECAGGGMLLLVYRGEPWKLTERERELVDEIAGQMRELEPRSMQEKLPKNL